MRSRAVRRPLACCFSTAFADAACTASSSRRSRSASLPAVVWMSMPESGVGMSVPWPGCVGCALTCPTLVPVNDATPRAAPRAPLALDRLQEAAGPALAGAAARRGRVDERAGRGGSRARPRRGRRPPDGRPRAARPQLGDTAGRRADVLRRRRPGRRRRVVAAGPAGRRVRRRPAPRAGRPEVAQRRAARRPQGLRDPGGAGPRACSRERQAARRDRASGSTSTRREDELPVADRHDPRARRAPRRPDRAVRPACCTTCERGWAMSAGSPHTLVDQLPRAAARPSTGTSASICRTGPCSRVGPPTSTSTAGWCVESGGPRRRGRRGRCGARAHPRVTDSRRGHLTEAADRRRVRRRRHPDPPQGAGPAGLVLVITAGAGDLPRPPGRQRHRAAWSSGSSLSR